MQEAIHYQRHIDGLRALAVASVVLFHLGATDLISGGFTGVDVFFVISGYLISKHIYAEVDTGQFSLWNFYERRARRILPALVTVTLITFAFVNALFSSSDVIGFSWSMISAFLFVANVHFYNLLGYFSPGSDQLPLLHYWSLGVEEQFYIFFPLLILALARFFPQSRPSVVFLLIVISAVASQLMLRRDPSAAFYLPQFRAYELLIGSFIALPGIRPAGSKTEASVASFVGAAGIMFALFYLNEDMRFPGFWALVPCIGTALIIWANSSRETTVGKALSLRPMAFVGRISYPLYLVHWPAIVIVKKAGFEINPIVQGGLILIGSIAASYLIYRVVETPIRHNRIFWSKRKVFGSGLAATIVIISFGSASMFVAGHREQLEDAASSMARWQNYDPTDAFRLHKCFMDILDTVEVFDSASCLPKKGEKSVVLWGDSGMAHFYPGTIEVAQRKGFQVGQITSSACPPVVNVSIASRPNCEAFNTFAFERVLDMKPDVLVLAARWNTDDLSFKNLHLMLSKLSALGIRVFVIGSQPVYKNAVPRLLAERIKNGNPSRLSDGDYVSDGVVELDKVMMKQVAKVPDVKFISLLQSVCINNVCPMESADGVPYYFDIFHMTPAGSSFYASKIIDLIVSPIKG